MRRSLILGLAASLAALAPAAHAACPAELSAQWKVGSSTLCVVIDDAALSQHQALLREWIDRSARIVADYYGQFPAQQVLIKLQGMQGGGVGGGRTTNEGGLMIEVRVGRDASAVALASDWVLVHEMVHLALPEVGRSHSWLAEGLAVYVEGVARAQFGNRQIADVWAEDRRSMPMGLPRAGEGGMDQERSWGRTYWGGALYCLLAEIGIREQTANRIGLQTALRAILRQTGGYGFERDINDVLSIGDAATGTHVMGELYRQMRTTPQATDLDSLWKMLGVPADPATQAFDDHAPLAPIRLAISAKPASP